MPRALAFSTSTIWRVLFLADRRPLFARSPSAKVVISTLPSGARPGNRTNSKTCKSSLILPAEEPCSRIHPGYWIPANGVHRAHRADRRILNRFQLTGKLRRCVHQKLRSNVSRGPRVSKCSAVIFQCSTNKFASSLCRTVSIFCIASTHAIAVL